MALELSVTGTMKNEMAGLLILKSHDLGPGATWLKAPPDQIAGNSNAVFSATIANSSNLTGTIVYLPAGSDTQLTFTFTVNGSNNTAQASYPLLGPTVGAQISQGTNAIATYTYAR